MKKLIASLVFTAFVAACHTTTVSSNPSPSPSAANLPGAADATAAVRAFLLSVEQQDLQAMGAVWGGPDGPARDLLSREELYKREFVLMCTLKHDRYDIVGEAPNPTGGRSIVVNLFASGDNRARTFDVVEGPAGRWYVKSIDLKTLSSCGRG